MGTKRFSDAQIIAAIKAKKGLIYLAAQRLKCTPETIYQRIKESPDVAQAVKDAREQLIDTTEEKLFQSIAKRDPWAITLTLKTLGKHRGYVERTEQEQIGTTKIQIVEQVDECVSDPPEASKTPPETTGLPPE